MIWTPNQMTGSRVLNLIPVTNLKFSRYVSRHEMFPLRAPLLSMESCIADFLDGCDANDDHKITLKEWGKCLGASDGTFYQILCSIKLTNLVFPLRRNAGQMQ